MTLDPWRKPPDAPWTPPPVPRQPGPGAEGGLPPTRAPWRPETLDARHLPAVRRARRGGLLIGAACVVLSLSVLAALLVLGGGSGLAPTPNADAAFAPLGTPPAVSAPPGSYAFVERTASGRPVAWDPCRPIRYVVNPEGEPANGRALIDIALSSVSQATGLTFRYAGTTDERPSRERRLFQKDRYGDRWAPVLISWTTAAELPEFADARIAQAGATAYGSGEQRAFVTGQVMLDRDKIERMLTTGAQGMMASAVVLHELGHLVGLDHVADEAQLMHPYSRDTLTRWGPGDLAGLAELGRGPCVPTI